MATYFEPTSTSGFGSVQYGTITFAAAGLSATATIAAVDTTRSSVILLGNTTDDGNAFRPFTSDPRIALTNSTTVTATRQLAGANVLVVSFVVVTWANPKSIQAGSITIANLSATNTATITAVIVARAILFWLGTEFDGGGAAGSNAIADLALTNSTTITATRVGNAGAVVVGFVVVEF